MVSASIPWVARMYATSIGWLKYGSPDFRFCPSCAFFESSYAFVIISRFAFEFDFLASARMVFKETIQMSISSDGYFFNIFR